MTYYGRPASQIQAGGAYGPVDAVLGANHLDLLKYASGLPDAEFEARFTRLSRRIDQLFSRGEHDQVFNGRWYIPFLVEDIRSIANTRPRSGLEQRLLSSLQSTINFDEAWTQHFKVPLRRVLDRVIQSNR